VGGGAVITTRQRLKHHQEETNSPFSQPVQQSPCTHPSMNAAEWGTIYRLAGAVWELAALALAVEDAILRCPPCRHTTATALLAHLAVAMLHAKGRDALYVTPAHACGPAISDVQWRQGYPGRCPIVHSAVRPLIYPLMAMCGCESGRNSSVEFCRRRPPVGSCLQKHYGRCGCGPNIRDAEAMTRSSEHTATRRYSHGRVEARRHMYPRSSVHKMRYCTFPDLDFSKCKSFLASPMPSNSGPRRGGQ